MSLLRSPMSMAKNLLIHQEGLKLKPYQDTVGKLTIGVGRNLTDRGISEAEALHLLANDILAFYRELNDRLPIFKRLDDIRQLALLSMAYNLGVDGLLAFTHMLDALHDRDYPRAARDALNSKWADQVGRRATEIANMLVTGELPDGIKP